MRVVRLGPLRLEERAVRPVLAAGVEQRRADAAGGPLAELESAPLVGYQAVRFSCVARPSVI